MNKKVVASALTISMLLSCSSMAMAANNKGRGKTDVPTYVNEKVYQDDFVKGNNGNNGNNGNKINNGNANGNKVKNVSPQTPVISKFRDLKSEHWAYRYANRMRYKHVIKGYEDGSFRPSNSIKEIEAVVMAVRLWNLENLDADTDLDDLTVPTWAEDYVKIAIDQGWIEARDFQPEKAASRSWVAKLLVKAMGLEDEAEAKMDEELSFTDAAAIDSADVGYIAVAVEEGFLMGYPNNTFRPNKPVTRAEMVTLLGRIDDELPVDEEETEEVQGIVEEITLDDADGNFIQIVTASDRERTFEVADDAEIFIGDEAADLDEINDGAKVKIIINEDELAEYVEVIPVRITGTVTEEVDADTDVLELDYDEDYDIAEDVEVIIGYRSGDLADVNYDDEVVVSLLNNQVSVIRVLTDWDDERLNDDEDDAVKQQLEGIFEDVITNSYDPDEDQTEDSELGDYLKLTTNGEVEYYLLGDDVEIIMDGEAIDLDEINEGAKIKVLLDDDEVIESIEVLPVQISGTVTEEVYDHSTVIEIDNDEDYTIADDVRVIIDHEPGNLEDVDYDDEVNLTLWNNEVSVIRVLVD